ncbi:hypothetical protein T06_6791 [Trichinella sp. T6]|nr:hypothetical protein T06_6791 [Trichinella sp. T6]
MFKVDNILSEILNCYVKKKSISKVECMRKLNKLAEDCVDKNIKLKCSDFLKDSNTLSLLEHLHPHLLHQICILFAIVCPVVDCRILVEYLQNCEQVFCEEFYLEVIEICDKKILKCLNEWKQYYNCMKSCVRNEIAEGPKYIDLEEVMEKVRYSIEVETIEK